MKFSERLAFCRKSKNLKQKQMAEFLGIGERAYQNYEYGTREPDLETFVRLADFFNVSLDYLAGQSDKPDRH